MCLSWYSASKHLPWGWGGTRSTVSHRFGLHYCKQGFHLSSIEGLSRVLVSDVKTCGAEPVHEETAMMYINVDLTHDRQTNLYHAQISVFFDHLVRISLANALRLYRCWIWNLSLSRPRHWRISSFLQPSRLFGPLGVR